MKSSATSPGVREPLYRASVDDTEREKRMLEEDEDMEIIITKIQEDTAYRSSSRIIQVHLIFPWSLVTMSVKHEYDDALFIGVQDIRGVLPCLITMLVLIIVIVTVFPYVFSYVFRSVNKMSAQENIHWEHSRLMERASKLQEWRAQHESTPDTQEETREDNITTIII